jgi:hypothetical protein
MPRYVILEHDHPVRHWDFMVEAGDKLRSWRLAAAPGPGQVVPAEPAFDHRLLYLDYEGPVSGERGNVSRWDAGTFRDMREEDGRVTLCLDGERLRGIAVLARGPSGDWSFALEMERDSVNWPPAHSRPG